MSFASENSALTAFRRAAQRVPAYRTLLAEAGVRTDEIARLGDLSRLPILEKRNTFQRFPLEQLCVDGELGRPGSVLTSSGHSGVFAFGLTDAATLPHAARAIDDQLDAIFGVRSQPTLLINCLPMGVKVPTEACTLAETSVRADMVVGLMKAFAHHHAQTILVGEAAFVKHLLELGRTQGLDWPCHRVHVILGEEPLAENARRYLARLLGHAANSPERGLIASSMGVAEIGLNLFSEVPPVGPLLALRSVLHDDAALRHALLGADVNWVPSIFVYDPRRLFVEFTDEGALLLTTLDPQLRVPLIRYATGDRGKFFASSPALQAALSAARIPPELWSRLPVVMIEGRGDHAMASGRKVFPEAVKEGLYHDPALAALTTANFRLVSDQARSSARVRIQLSPGVAVVPAYAEHFAAAIARHVSAPLEVACEAYEDFGSGMALDYERKFPYLAH
jgi:phenylacetate-CoA ligase